MKAFKGTPGPWVRDVYEIATQNGDIIFDLNYVGMPIAEDECNSNLIAAAPELLEALQRMTKLYESLMTDCGLSHKELIDSSHAAINKALGVK